jgi:general secretion pathway protein G
MKFFSKSEIISIIVIFLILVVLSVPNFTLSLRRARDQTRRNDVGSIRTAVENYYTENGFYPLTFNIPPDPHSKSGTTYVYLSDGNRYQIFAALEGADEAEYDAKIAARGIMCGNKICNMGLSNNVPLYMTIEEYNLQLYCKQHSKDPKCIK